MSGPYFIQGRTRFRLPSKHEAAALRAMKRDNAKRMMGDEVAHARTLEEALNAAGVDVHRDASGAIDGIRVTSSCYAIVEILDAFAPHVDRSSSIVLGEIESGQYAIHEFADGQRTETSLDELDDATDDLLDPPSYEEPQAALTWRQVQRSRPTSIAPYRPSHVYAVGEWLTHPKFGDGVIVATVESSKVRILFEAGERVLAHRS